MQGRGYFSDDVLMTVDGPVLAIDIVLGCATRVQLADSGQLSSADRVLPLRSIGDGIYHASVIHANKRGPELRRCTLFEHIFDNTQLH